MRAPMLLLPSLTRHPKANVDDIIALVEEKFERRLAEVKADLVRWMFVFWVGQIGVITGLLFGFFK